MRSASRTAAVLRALDADIIALQEVDEGVERSGGVDQPRELGRHLDMNHAFGSFMDYQGGRYGMAILSRHPIVREVVVPLPGGNERRSALAVEVALPGGQSLMAVGVHFDWVGSDSFRFRQATALTRFLDQLEMPYLVIGDFNDEPGSRTLALFSERAREAAKPAEDRLTFPSDGPVKEIDFIFGAPADVWGMEMVDVIDEPLASDHRPVVARMRLHRFE